MSRCTLRRIEVGAWVTAGLALTAHTILASVLFLLPAQAAGQTSGADPDPLQFALGIIGRAAVLVIPVGACAMWLVDQLKVVPWIARRPDDQKRLLSYGAGLLLGAVAVLAGAAGPDASWWQGALSGLIGAAGAAKLRGAVHASRVEAGTKTPPAPPSAGFTRLGLLLVVLALAAVAVACGAKWLQFRADLSRSTRSVASCLGTCGLTGAVDSLGEAIELGTVRGGPITKELADCASACAQTAGLQAVVTLLGDLFTAVVHAPGVTTGQVKSIKTYSVRIPLPPVPK